MFLMHIRIALALFGSIFLNDPLGLENIYVTEKLEIVEEWKDTRESQ